MDDRDWTILTMLGRERSISKVAEELFISQPSLTYRINKMEKFFGSQLFIRNNKGLLPTPQGEIAIQYAKRMSKELERVQEDIYSTEGKIKGTIYIASSSAVAQYLLPGLLSTFLQEYPGIEFNVVTGFSSNLVSLLSRGEIHVAFLREEIDWTPHKQLLSTENIYLVSQSPVQLQDLPQLPRIDYTTNPSLQKLIDRWWGQNFTVPPKITMKVDSAETSKEIVRAGLGYAVLTGLCMKLEDELCRVPLVDSQRQPLTRQTWIYGTEEALNYIAVRTFLDFVAVSMR